MSREVEEYVATKILKQLAPLLTQEASRHRLRSWAGQEPALEIHAAVAITRQHVCHSLGVWDTTRQRSDVIVIIDPYEQSAFGHGAIPGSEAVEKGLDVVPCPRDLLYPSVLSRKSRRTVIGRRVNGDD